MQVKEPLSTFLADQCQATLPFYTIPILYHLITNKLILHQEFLSHLHLSHPAWQLLCSSLFPL